VKTAICGSYFHPIASSFCGVSLATPLANNLLLVCFLMKCPENDKDNTLYTAHTPTSNPVIRHIVEIILKKWSITE
jgi:hypothetical protein